MIDRGAKPLSTYLCTYLPIRPPIYPHIHKQAAERAYIMTKSRRISRESLVLDKLASDLIAAAPTYLRQRLSVTLGGILPRLHDEEAAAAAELEVTTAVKSWRQQVRELTEALSIQLPTFHSTYRPKSACNR